MVQECNDDMGPKMGAGYPLHELSMPHAFHIARKAGSACGKVAMRSWGVICAKWP
jgi:hypothetical protein